MEASDYRFVLRKYPKQVVRYLTRIKTRYITIYHIKSSLKLPYDEARDIIYSLIDDNVVEKYATTFRISEDFWHERSKL